MWEIKQRSLVDMAAARGAYIDQSQSFNVHMDNANFGKLTSLHFYGWKQGLKTGMYYLRTRAAADAIKFTVDQTALKARSANENKAPGSDEKVAVVKAEKVPEKTAEKTAAEREAELAKMVCSLENKDDCVMCGS